VHLNGEPWNILVAIKGIETFMLVYEILCTHVKMNGYILKQWSLYDLMGIGMYFKVSFGGMVWFKTSVK
jgi:hypothetical protein